MQAMDTLGGALGEGRLNMAEFDERCRRVAEAQTQADLAPILADLPPQPAAGAVAQRNADAGDVFYSGREIMQTRRSGRRMRAGVFWLGTVGALGLTALHPIFLLAIPTLFILLYVMKVGPDDWYTPTVRQLEKHRRQAMRAQQLELETQRKMERQEQLSQLTGDAIGLAQNTVNRFKPRG